jgi:hypothetical protein
MSLLRLSTGIFLCSASAISFEIALTRVFSISLGYHFAFMIVSMAMLGLGLSGTILSLNQGLRKIELLGTYALGLSVAVLVGYAGTNFIPLDPARIAWDREQLLYIGVYYMLLAIPFLFFGMIVATAFAVETESASLVYGADLLGAGAGSIAAVFIMSGLGPEMSVSAIASAAVCGAFVFGRKKSSLAILVVIMILGVYNPGFMQIRMSQYRELQQALRYPGSKLLKTYYSGFSRVDTFESPMVRFAPGMSLKFLDDLPLQVGLAVDGAGINAITDASGDMRFLHYLPAALPYEIAERDRVLVVEPGGGLHVLLSREYGAGYIEKAGSNPLVMNVVREDFSGFSGGIYEKGAYDMLARSRLLMSNNLFDVVDVSLTAAVPSGGFGISENYTLTVEALEQYLAHLSPSGVVSLSAYLVPPPRTELRLLATAVAAMVEMGITDVGGHIAAIRSWGSINILIKREEFSSRELNLLRRFADERNFDTIYYPGIREGGTNRYVVLAEDEYFRAFRGIIDPHTRAEFIRDYLFDIRPVHDDGPFFHYFLKLDRLTEIINTMGGKWQFIVEEGYLLPVVLLQVMVLSLIILLIPAVKRPARRGPASLFIYFGLLGMGFMFVEVPLIQAMILPLGNPSYAMAAVLASVLIWSGTGGLLSLRYPILSRPRTLALIAVIVILSGFYLPFLAGKIAGFPLVTKLVFSFMVMMPVALFMGIPFPMGIRLAGQRYPGMIPWAWAVNGCLSVMSPMLAAILALQWGFRVVFLAGALMYAIAFAVISTYYSQRQ